MTKLLERGAAVGVSLLLVFVALELSLRLVGGLDPGADVEREDGAVRVLCIGESTTAMGGDDAWPAQLEGILAARSDGQRYQVINRALGGADSSVLMARLDDDLDRYQPHVLVAMMGANDPVGSAAAQPYQPPRRAIPDHGASLADREGPARWLKSWRLVELLVFELGREPSEPSRANSAEPTARGDHEVLLELLGTGRTRWPPPVIQAWELVERGEPDQAHEVLEAGAQTDPTNPQLLRELAIVHESLGQPDDAERGWRAMLAQGSAQHYALFGLAHLLASQDRCAEAAEIADQAVSLDPLFGPALVHLGLCWSRQGQDELAEAALRRATARRRAVTHLVPPAHLNPDLLPRFHQEADDLYAVPGAAEAWPPLAEPLMRNPQDPANDLALLNLLEVEGHEDRLLAEAGRLVGGSNSSVVMARIAWIFQERGQGDLAARAQARTLELLAHEDRSPTRQAYDRLEAATLSRGIPLVVAQYANRPLGPLRALRAWDPSVVLVDSRPSFQAALAEHGFDALFIDHCYGDLGHGSPLGNRILAQNIAAALAPLLPATP